MTYLSASQDNTEKNKTWIIFYWIGKLWLTARFLLAKNGKFEQKDVENKQAIARKKKITNEEAYQYIFINKNKLTQP